MGADARVSTQSNKISSTNSNLTLGIFFFLFLTRLASGFVLKITHGDGYPIFTDFITVIGLAFFTFTILFNRWNLSDLNIGRNFIYTFIISSILLFLYFGISLIGIVTFICLVLTLRVSLRYMFEFNNKEHNYQAFLYVALGIAPVILLKLFAHNPSTYINSFRDLSSDKLYWIIIMGLWNVVFEEFLFRGLLWMILSRWMFDTKKIIITQAFLFWLVHLNLIVRPYFGINAFLFGLWLGYLTLRSKSLIPGTLAHFVWNITANLITII